MDFLIKFIYSFILACSLLYIWHKLIDKKINFRNYRLYVTLIGITFISIFNYFLVNKFIRISLIIMIFMFFFRYLFKETIQKCIVTPIFYQMIIMASETIVILIVPTLFNLDTLVFIETALGKFVTNILVAIISVLLVKLKFIRNICRWILKLIEKIKIDSLLIFCIFAILTLGVFPMTIYYKISFSYLLFFYSTMTISCFLIVVYLFKTQNKYNKVSDRYNIAINSLKDYENMMTKYRISNHENKNLLLTVRAMIINNELDIPKYIDSIIDNKYNDDEKLLFEMSVIPTGGLRATIYSEILKIQEKNIKYSLNVDKQLSTIDLIELDENTIIDICKIICVFIDNAIDEVEKLKRKNIDIQLYLENETINIKVSNNYKNKIEIDKLYESGYTTKGKNHGYGLSLVKTIIENNKILGNKIEINSKIFSQILIIKYKKTS